MDHIGIDVHKRDSQIYILVRSGEVDDVISQTHTPAGAGARWVG